MEYKCNICNKKYVSYKSLWNHNAKFHRENVVINFPKEEKNVVINLPVKIVKDSTICNFCGKKLCDRKYRWKHEQKCKEKEINVDKKIDDIKKEFEKQIEKKELEHKKEMSALKELLYKSLKVHPKTFNKINNQLINQNSNNNNNNTINNINIVQLGNENLIDVLTEKQKLKILERQAMSINDLVELLHTSPEYKQFKNVCVTNLQSSFAQKYDEKSKRFIAVNKKDVINDVVDCRMYDIGKFFEENQSKMNPQKAEKVKKFIDRMNNEDDTFKGGKKEEIQLILYNNNEAKDLIV
jgi:hypothetical protein